MKEPLPILICITLIIVALVVAWVLTWEAPPWWRTNPTPRRKIDDAKDAVRLYKIEHRHPEVFGLETRRRKMLMATKMFFSSQNCQGVDSGYSGKHYEADSKGFIHVDDARDAASLVAGGYVQAGAVARSSRYWVCDDCSRDCNINHCPKCDSDDLRKIVAE